MNFPRISLPRLDTSRISVQGYGKMLAIGAAAVLGLAALGAAGSGISRLIDSQMPESAPRNFVHGLVAKNCTQMLDHVCGTFACPTLPNNITFEIRDESYTVLENDGKNAKVLVYMDVRFKVKSIGEGKVALEPLQLEVTKPGNQWCVQKGTNIQPLLEAFAKSIIK